MSKPFEWGILSTAAIVKKAFLPALEEAGGGTAAAVASRTLEKAKQYAREQAIPRAHGSYQALLDDPDVEAVYIGLPNSMHEEWIVNAARAGKHVFCEKPLTVTREEADRAVKACKEEGVLLVEAFVYRFHRHTLHIRELLDSGTIGEVLHTDATFHIGNTIPNDNIRMIPELGGGALMDVGAYVLSWTRFVMGTLPSAVAAHSEWDPQGVDRHTTALLRFPGNRTAQASCAFGLHGSQSARVYGTRGVLEVHQPFHPNPERSRITLHRGRETTDASIPIPQFPFSDAITAFQDAIRKNAPLPFDTDRDMLEQASTIDAVRKAAHENNWVEPEPVDETGPT